MPVHKEGSGYQWGGHGKVYHGPEAKAKAAAQGRAAYANGYRELHHQKHQAEASRTHHARGTMK